MKARAIALGGIPPEPRKKKQPAKKKPAKKAAHESNYWILPPTQYSANQVTTTTLSNVTVSAPKKPYWSEDGSDLPSRVDMKVSAYRNMHEGRRPTSVHLGQKEKAEFEALLSTSMMFTPQTLPELLQTATLCGLRVFYEHDRESYLEVFL